MALSNSPTVKFLQSALTPREHVPTSYEFSILFDK